MRKTDGIILDVDGTLWDSTPIVADAWTQAVHACGYPDYLVTDKLLKQLFGRTMAAIAQCMFPDEPKEKQLEVMDRCCEYEDRCLAENECRVWYPEVPETIRALSERLPVFIVSNCQSGYIELFLEKSGLGPYVTDIECFGNNGKSKGENIRLLADRNHLQSPIYVGDTQGDCDASDEAGVPFIYAEYGFGEADHMDGKITHFGELLELFK